VFFKKFKHSNFLSEILKYIVYKRQNNLVELVFTTFFSGNISVESKGVDYVRQLDQHRSRVANVPRHSGEEQRGQGFAPTTSGHQFNGNRSSETGIIYRCVLGLIKEEEEVGGANTLIKILLLSAPSRL